MSRDGRLFPELNDKILDLLADDHKTLAVCALVCSGWRTRSQYLLFRRFELVFVARPLSQNQNQKGERYDHFIHRLRTTILANPFIVAKVHDLLVDFKPEMTRKWNKNYGVHAEMLLSLPFTNLESLYMRYGIHFSNVLLQNLETPPVIRLNSFLRSNLSLRRVVMDSIFLNRPESLEFLTTLGNLHNLTDLAWKGTWGSTEGHCQVDLPIKRLCWYSDPTFAGYEISGWGRLTKLSRLEELALLNRRIPHREVTWFLQTCAATLRHLTLPLEAFIQCPDKILENLHLSHLRLLDPGCRILRPDPDNLPLESKLSRLRTLRSVSIISSQLVEIGRERLAASWADRALANLKSLTASHMVPEINVCVWNGYGGVQLEGDISRMFPVTSQSAGLLKDTLPSFWWPSSFLAEVMGCSVVWVQ